MGSPKKEIDREFEELQHKVTLTKSFYIMDTEVTQKLFQAIMNNNPSTFKNPMHPVENVDYNMSVKFATKLSEILNINFTLPTEAQWEYACRAETLSPFAFGNTINSSQVNFDGNYSYGNGPKSSYRKKTHPVASFPPNKWGIYDMHGNVWEWCSDSKRIYGADITDPYSKTGSSKILRGGSWDSVASYCRSAYRSQAIPSKQSSDIGFRLIHY